MKILVLLTLVSVLGCSENKEQTFNEKQIIQTKQFDSLKFKSKWDKRTKDSSKVDSMEIKSRTSINYSEESNNSNLRIDASGNIVLDP